MKEEEEQERRGFFVCFCFNSHTPHSNLLSVCVCVDVCVLISFIFISLVSSSFYINGQKNQKRVAQSGYVEGVAKAAPAFSH